MTSRDIFYASAEGKIYYYSAIVEQTTSLLLTEMLKVSKTDFLFT